jgi:hypothetical protein
MTFVRRIMARAFKAPSPCVCFNHTRVPARPAVASAMPSLFGSLTLPFRVLPSLLGVGVHDSGATLALAQAQE